MGDQLSNMVNSVLSGRGALPPMGAVPGPPEGAPGSQPSPGGTVAGALAGLPVVPPHATAGPSAATGAGAPGTISPAALMAALGGGGAPPPVDMAATPRTTPLMVPKSGSPPPVLLPDAAATPNPTPMLTKGGGMAPPPMINTGMNPELMGKGGTVLPPSAQTDAFRTSGPEPAIGPDLTGTDSTTAPDAGGPASFDYSSILKQAQGQLGGAF